MQSFGMHVGCHLGHCCCALHPNRLALHQAAKLGLVDGCGTMHATMRQQYGDKVLCFRKGLVPTSYLSCFHLS